MAPLQAATRRRPGAAAHTRALYTCTSPLTIAMASVPSLYTESERADGPGRKRATFALDGGPALLPHRHAIDVNPVTTEPLDVRVLFFFYDKT